MSTQSYTAATTVDEVLEAMAAGARPIAGGTDLVVGARGGKAPLPDALVAIHRVSELRGIRDQDGGLVLGALATHADIVASSTACELFTALADASAIVGSHATRNAGTIGGNVMNASPAMETGGPLICFDAVAMLRSASGSRRVALADLFTGPGQHRGRARRAADRAGHPRAGAGTGSCYARLEYRRQMEIAIVGATAVVDARRRHRPRRAHRHHRSGAHHPPRGRGRAGAERQRRPRTPPCTRRRMRRRPPRGRSRTCAVRPTTGGRWRP